VLPTRKRIAGHDEQRRRLRESVSRRRSTARLDDERVVVFIRVGAAAGQADWSSNRGVAVRLLTGDSGRNIASDAEAPAGPCRRTRGRRVGGGLRWLFFDQEQHKHGAEPGPDLGGRRALWLDRDGCPAIGVPNGTPPPDECE
jgi:hypothetical protein